MIINFLGQLYGELELAANVRLRAKTRNEHTRKWHQGFGSFPQFGTDIRLVGRHQKFRKVFLGSTSDVRG